MDGRPKKKSDHDRGAPHRADGDALRLLFAPLLKCHRPLNRADSGRVLGNPGLRWNPASHCPPSQKKTDATKKKERLTTEGRPITAMETLVDYHSLPTILNLTDLLR
jgi:hypothetical protein